MGDAFSLGPPGEEASTPWKGCSVHVAQDEMRKIVFPSRPEVPSSLGGVIVAPIGHAVFLTGHVTPAPWMKFV